MTDADAGRYTLPYTPPLAWDALLGFLGGRGAAGVEAVDGARYLRTVRLGGQRGWVVVEPASAGRLTVLLSAALVPVADAVLSRLRALLDLDADPAAVIAVLGRDALLAPVVAAEPGLRVPGGFDGFELCLRAILGQQVTVKAATTLFGRFAAAFGEPVGAGFPPALRWQTPLAAAVAAAPVQALIDLGLTERRAQTIHGVATAFAAGRLRFEPAAGAEAEAERAAFLAIPGIGRWTTNYVAMRAQRDADAFPTGDLALCKALGGISAKDAERQAERWRPYRAYAALYLWRYLRAGTARDAGG